jgi:hypothetical protein
MSVWGSRTRGESGGLVRSGDRHCGDFGANCLRELEEYKEWQLCVQAVCTPLSLDLTKFKSKRSAY